MVANLLCIVKRLFDVLAETRTLHLAMVNFIKN